MKKLIVGIGLFVLVAASGFAWYYFYGPCGRIAVQQASDEIAAISGDWEDAVSLADSTPRMSLAPQIERLQNIQDDLQSMSVPACMEDARDQVDEGMAGIVLAYTMFLGQADDSEVSSEMMSGFSRLFDGQSQVEEIRECAPFCRPDPYEMQAP